MDLRTHNIIKLPMSLLRFMGQYSETNHKKVILLAFIYCALNFFCFCFEILIQFPMIKEITDVVTSIEALGTFCQTTGKFIANAYQQKALHKLVKRTELFWSINNCDKEHKTRINRTINLFIGIEKFFCACELITLPSICIYSIWTGELAFGIWVIKGHHLLHTFLLIGQIVLLPILGCFISAYDSFFLGFCGEILTQFQILCACVKELKTENVTPSSFASYRRKLQIYIRHHQYLLSVFKDFQNLYMPAILLEYFTISPLICVTLYALLEEDRIEMKMKHALICVCVTVQLAFYCIPGDYVTAEALALSDAIYDSNWHLQLNSVDRRCLINMMTKMAQRPLIIKAAGMIELNSRTLLTVFKVSWSACTVIRRLRRT